MYIFERKSNLIVICPQEVLLWQKDEAKVTPTQAKSYELDLTCHIECSIKNERQHTK